MGGQILRALVGLDLGDPPAVAPVADLADQDLAEELGRYLESVSREEVLVEDTLGRGSDERILEAERAWLRRLSA